MPLSDIVMISITTDSVRVTQAGFGIPLILSTLPTWTERTREYTDLAGMVTDGFVSTRPEYKVAERLFAQNPRPERVIVGRLANKPTQRFKISVSSVLNLTKYRARVGATWFEYTSDGTATNDEIVAGLVALINGGVDTLTASAIGGAGAQQVQLLGDAAGAWDAVEVGDVALLSLVQDHADPGYATDLAAILLENKKWYAILNPWNSKAVVDAVAAWTEANKRMFIADVVDTPIEQTVKSGTDDVGESTNAASLARTALFYARASDRLVGAAEAGKCLPMAPGSETWMFKNLSGPIAEAFTGTQLANLKAKAVNWYEDVAGIPIVSNGTVAAGEFIDVVRFRDWLEARMQEGMFADLVKPAKLPYTDRGIAVIQARAMAVLQAGVEVGGLSDSPAPAVTVPKAATVSSADKNARILRNVKFSGTLAGAIHKLEIQGNISV